MAIDYVRNIISSGYNLSKINDNFTKIEDALQDGLSRSGNGPNQMEADLDLNNNDLINVNNIDAASLKINGESVQPVDITTALKIDNNLSDVEDVVDARSNLGLGNSATRNVGTTASTVAAGDDSRIIGAVQSSYLSPRLPGLTDDVFGTGYPGLDGGPWFIYQHPVSFTEKPALWVQKDYVAGGTTGNTYPTQWIVGNTNPNDAGFAWVSNIQLNNHTKKTTLAENVAMNAYAKKLATGDGTETGATWGANIVAQDDTAFATPTAGLIGAEIAVAAESTDPNRTRRAIQVVGGGPSGTVHGYGIFIGPRPGVIFDRPLSLISTGGGSFNVGFDTSDASIVSGVALMMKEGHGVAFDGTPAGAFSRVLKYNAGTLHYDTPSGGSRLSVDDNGNLTITGRIKFSVGVDSTSASGGAATALPANPVGYISFEYPPGTQRKFPYYNV